MCNTKEKFYNWLGMKLYNGSELFKNVVYGIYYEDVQLPNVKKISDLVEENMLLKQKLNAAQTPTEESIVEEVAAAVAEKPTKKRRKYTKRKKEVKE
jgi:hypothetical protein